MSRSSVCPLCQSSRTAPYFRKDGFDPLRCGACDVLFVHPQPSNAALYTSSESDYHGWMRTIDVERWEAPPQHRRAFRDLESKARLGASRVRAVARAPGRLLDVGCSAGFFLRQARAAGFDVEGIEPNPVTAEVARRAASAVVHCARLEDAGVPEASFDVVTAWDVIEHLARPADLLAFARRVLTASGLLLLTTPNYRGLFPRLSYRAASVLGRWPHPEPPAHTFQFSEAAIVRTLEAGGFRVERVFHDAIDLGYTFGRWSRLARSPGAAAYAALFAVPALLGPLLRAGDALTLVARMGRD